MASTRRDLSDLDRRVFLRQTQACRDQKTSEKCLPSELALLMPTPLSPGWARNAVSIFEMKILCALSSV